MKKLFLLGLVGLFSAVSVLEVQAGRRHCGGRHHRRGGGCCYAQPAYNGCYTNGHMNGGYVDPNVGAGAGVGVEGAGVGAEAGVDAGGAGAGANVRGRLP